MNKHSNTLGIALFLIAGNAIAAPENQQNTFSPQFSVFAGITNGGDAIGFGGQSQVQSDQEGQNNTTNYDETLKAGGFAVIGSGVNFKMSHQFNIQLNASYHWDQVQNPDAKFTRFAFEVLPYYQLNQQMKLGLGFTQHFNVKSSGNITPKTQDTSSVLTADFNNPLGLAASFNYQFESFPGSIELRAVKIDYDIDMLDQTGKSKEQFSVKGDHFGLYYHWLF